MQHSEEDTYFKHKTDCILHMEMSNQKGLKEKKKLYENPQKLWN